MRTWVIDHEAVESWRRLALSTPEHLAMVANGIRGRELGSAYLYRIDALDWHQLSAAEKAPWLEKARLMLDTPSG